MTVTAHGSDAMTAVREARSFLFVPGDRPERFAKALASGADAVVIDLEDAVAPGAKALARAALEAAWPGLVGASDAALVVRINAPGAPEFDDDLALCARLAPAAVLVPKAELVGDFLALRPRLPPTTAVLALIETARGLAGARALAMSGIVDRLALGHIDLQADLGLRCGPDEAELVPARFEVVLASRLGDLPPPIDGVTTDFRDAERVHDEAARALRMGYGAKLCIHPAQVAPVHAAFAPSADELTYANRVLAAAQAAAGGAIQLDGRMVDRPVVLLAERTLRRARPI